MLPLLGFVADMATPKLLAFMSAGVSVVPQRSEGEPYIFAEGEIPHGVIVSALLLPLAAPPIIRRTDESTIWFPPR